MLQLELHELVKKWFINQITDVHLVDQLLALQLRTKHRKSAVVYLSFDELSQTFEVVDMFALRKRDHFVFRKTFETNAADERLQLLLFFCVANGLSYY